MTFATSILLRPDRIPRSKAEDVDRNNGYIKFISIVLSKFS